MRRLLAFRYCKHALTPLFVGVLVVVANVTSLSAQADPTPSSPAATTPETPAKPQPPASPAVLKVIAVAPIPTLKFDIFPCWETWFPIPCWWRSETGSFDFTLFDKSGGGTFSHVHARLDSDSVDSKSIASNFTFDKLSFWDGGQEVHLKQLNQDSNLPSFTSQQTLKTKIAALSPGEYKGTLRFAANGTAEDAAEAKLPLVIQVRHHWLFPVLFIFLASLVGWFSSSYVVGVRKARDLSQQVKALRYRADSLSRRSDPNLGWESLSEAESLGFTYILVMLSRLGKLTALVTEVIFHGEDINKDLQRADQCLSALEKVHAARLSVQSIVVDYPAVKVAINNLLQSATDLLALPTYGEDEKAKMTELLKESKTWASNSTSPETFLKMYKKALVDRWNGHECPTGDEVTKLKENEDYYKDHKNVIDELLNLFKYLLNLFNDLPNEKLINDEPDLGKLDDIEKLINDEPDLGKLRKFDDIIAQIALLWRDRNEVWAKEFKANKPLSDMFDLVDRCFWEELKKEAEKEPLVVELSPANHKPLKTYEVVEVNLNTHKIEPSRILYHPLRVRWNIKQTPEEPKGFQEVLKIFKTMLEYFFTPKSPVDEIIKETKHLTLVHYFQTKREVDVKATLLWANDSIPINKSLSFLVVKNPEYGKPTIIKGIIPEVAAIVAATLFAIVTALSTQYDSTFGTMNQYLALFIWAAGAGTGGNLFSQLGPKSAPGGDPAAKLK